MDLATPASPIADWGLAADVVHLNHGSYGGCPRAVLAAADAVRARLEAAPMRFYVLEWQGDLDRVRAALAAFLLAPDDRLVFVPNATTGVAHALAAARIEPGDELLTTSHAYRACKNQLSRLAEARGARIVTAPVALPFDPDQIVDAIARAITPRTRLALIDHVTSPTALVLPLERIVAVLAARGIPIAVDGAHAPGQLELDLGRLLAAGVTWYAGNHHKWLCAPKASGFLVTTTPLVPLVTSHGASPEYGPPNRLHAELDWSGTYDPAPQLAVPAAIHALQHGIRGDVMARNHALVVEMAARLRDALGADRLARDADLGAMAALPIALPPGETPGSFQAQLLRDGWEVAIVDFPDGPLVRVSAHAYNHAGEADALAAKLHALGARGRRI